MSKRRLPVVLCWHMHQPHYRDALTGEYVFPWTYLHAIKDYSDMAAHLEANPRARAVVNFTPVLLEQLDELAQRVGQCVRGLAPSPDPVLAVLTDEPLPHDPAKRLALLQACLRAQRTHMIERFAPFKELAELATTFGDPQRIVYASDQFLHDLGVWYHLAWLGESVRLGDARVRVLLDKRGHFTRADRHVLLEVIADVLAGIIPRYRRLAESGQCELAVSPYSHPILPLLLDFRAARDSVPGSELPRHEGYDGGDDRAAWHMAEALRVFTRHFGVRPRGCWPSEGAVSDGAFEIIDRFGFDWAASSANVLRAALARAGELNGDAGGHSGHAGGPADGHAGVQRDREQRERVLFDRPYSLPGQRLAGFFRHDHLSDLIGFTYATWHGDDAALNLAHELAKLADAYEDDPRRCVLIALDGENAWEHFPFNGWYFLRALYAALADHPQIELTTLSDYLRASRGQGVEPTQIPHLVAGSWVHGTLATWMGDAAKNAGWDLLCEAKQHFDRVMAEGALTAEQQAAAERQLAQCESSDWFWWFGDYNPADAVASFDQLYRRQLTVLYRMLGLEPPAVLLHPLSSGGHGAPEHGGVMRRANAG